MDGTEDDLFALQAKLSQLIAGLDEDDIPQDLKDQQRWLWKRASALARQRAAARSGAPTQPIQQFNDCWTRCLYDLGALAPLRQTASYAAFLERVCREYPERDIKQDGLSFKLFYALAKRLSLDVETLITNESQLVDVLDSKGPVIGGIGYFEIDTCEMSARDALPYWRQHAMLIVAWTGQPGNILFTAHDPSLTFATRYTQSEMDVLQLIVYRVDANPQTAAALREFIAV